MSPKATPFLPFAEGRFGTPSGKCEFGAEMLEYAPPVESRFGDDTLRRKFPLEMVSSKNDDSMNSTFGNRDAVDQQTRFCTSHSKTPPARGIRNGDLVRAFNDRGSVILTAEVDGVVRPRRGACASGALGQALARRP